jgi:hypothetical protein
LFCRTPNPTEEVFLVASRLYGTTRRLYTQVVLCLSSLGIMALGSPTTAALVALYVTGLVFLDERQTQTRVALFLPGRCHDAINRLLRLMPLSSRALFRLVIGWIKARGWRGYLVLDDVVVEKAFARKLPWAGWTYSFSKKRTVYGLHIVVVLWTSGDGTWRIPVAFRLHRPKRSVGKADYRSRVELALDMVEGVVAERLAFDYIVFDSQYTAGWFNKKLSKLGIVWIGSLKARNVVVYQGGKCRLDELAGRLKLKWRKGLALRAQAVSVYAPTFGHLRLVVARNRHGNYEYTASNDHAADLTCLVGRRRSRWSIETIFRDTKQYGGLEACQAWVDQAMVRHVALVLLAFIVMQMLRISPAETVADIKVRWQMEITRGGQSPPAPLKACPPHLRRTA